MVSAAATSGNKTAEVEGTGLLDEIIDAKSAADDALRRHKLYHEDGAEIIELPLAKIRTDGSTQIRVELSKEVYLEYRDNFLADAWGYFDAIDVFFDGQNYWLADGFHRFYGAREAGLKTIQAAVHKGSRADAILFACGANYEHGLRRTNADKRNAVETILGNSNWATWSNGVIAELCHVTPQFVGSIRRPLETVSSSPAAKAADRPRVGLDGKKRKAKPAASVKPAKVSTTTAVVTEPTGIFAEIDFDAEPENPAVCAKAADGQHAWDEDGDGRFCSACKCDYIAKHHGGTKAKPAASTNADAITFLNQCLTEVQAELEALQTMRPGQEKFNEWLASIVTLDNVAMLGYGKVIRQVQEQAVLRMAREIELCKWLDQLVEACNERITELTTK